MTDQNRDFYFTIIEKRADIGGRFTNIRRAGHGVFSLVFRATDKTTGQDVAIKVFDPRHMTNAYRYQCFEREARILESLNGQRDIIRWVCAKSEFTEQMTMAGLTLPFSFSYYALEIASRDVDKVIECGGWTPDQILCNFRTMCRSVQRIHHREISHRDVKPSNFMVLSNGDVRLSDFGTARDVAKEPAIVSEYGWPPGDTRYTAPEMLALLHDEDPAIAYHGDLFALGAVLFELCTGAKLGTYLYQPQFIADLTQAMGAVRKGDRKRVYHQYVTNIAHAQVLPDISAFSTSVPRCIGPRLNVLYKSMAAIDYRKRLSDFEQIFRRIDQCLIVLRNEEKYKSWRRQKEIYKRNRDDKKANRERAVGKSKSGA